ncbi:MAG: ACT domain-containing protein [Candidatus Diapherotrites archaeon]|uniref:ACT domain-containing protein n=1 Tax=Candidatus Iainarchaeum sp. TaxID=3101447 RepID=A0A939C702_9ARCH|nr:ACT domain-containing protein [Candidatus Diapherotrites archaeon]
MSIARKVGEYIAGHPSVKDCLKKGLINYSALSRAIIRENKLDSEKDFDAVLVACRRYAEKKQIAEARESKIKALLKKSSLEIKNRVCVAILSKGVSFSTLIELGDAITSEGGLFHLIQGASTFTLITDERFFPKIEKKLKARVIAERNGLVEILITAPRDIETTSGVTAFLYTLFGENGINILETMSSWTDTLFLIEEKDAARAMEILRF